MGASLSESESESGWGSPSEESESEDVLEVVDLHIHLLASPPMPPIPIPSPPMPPIPAPSPPMPRDEVDGSGLASSAAFFSSTDVN